MHKIDLGVLNKKQINKVIEGIARSDINIIEMHILKVKENLSMVLNFLTKKEKDRFDAHSEKLIKDLKELNCPAAWR